MAGRGHQLGLSSDGERRFQLQQLPLRGPVQLTLLPGRVPPVSLRDVLRDPNGGHHRVLGEALDLASVGLAQGADDIGTEGDRFLPCAQVLQSQSHGAEYAAVTRETVTENLRRVY